MRQIFTSQRLETVEGVARLLEDAGIPVHISQPRSYRSRRSGQFSYAEPVAPNKQPAVWVRIPEDQPRARELLRKYGLLATTRSYADLPPSAVGPLELGGDKPAGNRWAWRVRIGLLAVIAAVAVVIWLRRPVPVATPVPPPAEAVPQTQDGGEEEVRIRISPAPPANDAPAGASDQAPR
ncbi:hypothetical protein [Pseudoxanthomonas suwonensis]